MLTLSHMPRWLRLVGWIFRRWLDRVPFAAEDAARLRSLAESGRVIWLVREAGWTDTLVWWWLCRVHDLPRLERVYGFGRRTDHLSLSSIDVPTGALVVLKETQLADRDPIERLVRQVRSDEQAPPVIHLVPLLFIWNARPRSMERSFLDIVLGSRGSSNGLRKLLWMLIGPARTKVVVGEEIKLHEFAAGDRDSPETVARKVRLSVRVFLAREERAVLGPRLVPRRRLLDRALRDPGLRQTLRDFSDETGRSMDDVESEVRRNLDEIAADYNWTAIRLFELALSKVWTRIYEDFQIDLDGLERVRELTKSGPIILVPTHKSHMDYLILSYLFKMNEIPPPHIAAGINLSFFPVGQLFRRCGAFFIRRSFLGDRLYEAAMRTYIRSLLRERYNLEFFIEGTRSRSGKIMPPKFGMLSMAVEALEGFSENCHIVPVAIDYESLVEEASIVKEAAGGEKSKESVGGLLRARKTLGRRYGSVYVRFAEEIDARQALATLRDEGHTGHAAVRRLAYHVLGGMERAVTVTATSLVATAIVVHHKRGIREETLRARVRLLQDAVRRSGAQLSSEFLYGQQLDTDRALDLLLGSRALKVIELQGERVYTVDDEYRMTLDYYKNNTVHFLVDLSFAALSFRLRREDTFESLWEGYALLHALFLEEFHRVYTPPQPDELRAVLAWLVERKFIEEQDGLWRVLEPAEIMAFENVTRNFLESAFIAVVALLEGHNDGTPRGMADWLRHTMEIGDLLYARGDIWRSESRSKVNLQNALNSHRHSGLLVEIVNEGGGRRRRTVWVLANDATAVLSRMRDDLQRILGEVQLN